MTTYYTEPDPSPVGVNPLNDGDRKHIYKLINGDILNIRTYLVRADDTPVNVSNSAVKFVVSDQRFGDPLFTAVWGDNLVLDGDDGHIKITIPQDVTATFRRGSFIYSIAVSDSDGQNIYTALTGSLLVEYEPTSPSHDIPYKD